MWIIKIIVFIIIIALSFVLIWVGMLLSILTGKVQPIEYFMGEVQADIWDKCFDK